MMNFARLAVLSALLAATSVSAGVSCNLVGNVTLLWGTVSDNTTTATPIGFSTASTAPTDAGGHVLLATRTDIPAHAWGAYQCIRSTAGGGGGGNSGGGGGGGGGTMSAPPAPVGPTMFGVIGQTDPNLCLTVSGLDTGNLTISRQTCIGDFVGLPDQSQSFQWTFSTAPVLQSLVFIGDQSTVALTPETPTNYIPSLFGPVGAIGDYVRFDFQEGALLQTPETPGLLIDFVSFMIG
ncbi:hypothetical protein MSAN_01381500 [Mycena sanguinolenta]|uniref:Ig-like domain-containing protein n=1 Tax=Mycena sanguinolenta TaxID=230812 RepID=A0A8H6Y5N5_9AGAR|nr:hypothetical protein MSAN_01381500 [Mycena sanguinolenta]